MIQYEYNSLCLERNYGMELKISRLNGQFILIFSNIQNILKDNQ